VIVPPGGEKIGAPKDGKPLPPGGDKGKPGTPAPTGPVGSEPPVGGAIAIPEPGNSQNLEIIPNVPNIPSTPGKSPF
jgi:hypothetical protein